MGVLPEAGLVVDGLEEVPTHPKEVIEEVAALAKEKDASIVVLSWRGGGDSSTREWLKFARLDIDTVFIPGAADDICGYSGNHTSSAGQVGFKVSTIRALRALGHEVVASFDDRTAVCKALESEKVPDVRKVPHLVTPLPHEYDAGYIGAPKPKPETKSSGNWKSNDRWWEKGSGSLINRHQQSFFDDYRDLDDELDELMAEEFANAKRDPYESQRRFEEVLNSIGEGEDRVEMSEVLDDPDAPPLRLHEIKEVDNFYLSEFRGTKKRNRRGGSKR